MTARIVSAAVVALFLGSATSCTSSSIDDKATATTKVTVAGGSGSSGDEVTDGTVQWSTDTSVPSGDAVYLVADWEIEIGDFVRSVPDGQTGIPDGVICEGKIRLSIRVDGTFRQSGRPKCEQDKGFRNAEIKSTGNWRIAGQRIEFYDEESKGQIYLVKGIEPFTPGVRDGIAAFSIDGDTLSLTVEEGPEAATVTRWQYADPE